jgi:hypothetical protein
MATHDYVIANQTGANTRSDLNNALSAIVSNNSSATAPATTYAYMWWADTTNDLLKQRNAADNAWIDILTLSTGAVSNAAIADDAITLAKMAGGTDGELITYDTSGDPTTVPTGSSGEVLTSNGAGTTPTFQAAAGGGLYASVAIIQDQKAAQATGGSTSAESWLTRDLNTEVSDADGIVSISSNQFTLQAGTYTIKWTAPASGCDRHQTRLKNVTDTTYSVGGLMIASGADNVENRSVGATILTIASAKVFIIQHYAQSSQATSGFGSGKIYDSSVGEVFTSVEIYKHS